MEKHEIQSEDENALLTQLAGEEFCYLTTIGRLSGRAHKIEIWFGIRGSIVYLLSGGKAKSDWVKNLIKNPSVTVWIANHTFSGKARIVSDEEEERMARYLLAEKYQEWEAGKRLSEWARSALPVAIDLAAENR